MRKYKIVIRDKGKIVKTYESKKGIGLDVDFTIQSYDLGGSANNSTLRIWGIELSEIKSSKKYNEMSIDIYGGMEKGMPLADYQHYGLLAKSVIQQCIGVWSGTDTYLDFYLYSGSANGLELVLDCAKGNDIHAEINQAISKVLPNSKITVNADAKNTTEDCKGVYYSLEALSQATGIPIYSNGTTITIGGKKPEAKPIEISITELIGQVTWVKADTINFTTSMRADISAPTTAIKLPKSLSVMGLNAALGGNELIINGTYQVVGVRHIGSFNNSDGETWATNFDAIVMR